MRASASSSGSGRGRTDGAPAPLAAVSALRAAVPDEAGPAALNRPASVSAVGWRGFVRGTGSSVGTATESTGATCSACVALHVSVQGDGAGTRFGAPDGNAYFDAGPAGLIIHEARAVGTRESSRLVFARQCRAERRRVGGGLRARDTDCRLRKHSTVTTPALARSCRRSP